MTPEVKIERAFVTFAKCHGCEAYKFVSPERKGVPDRLVVGPGFSFFIEFKAPGEVPSKQQEREIKRLRDLGQNVYVCDREGQAEAILLLKLRPPPAQSNHELWEYETTSGPRKSWYYADVPPEGDGWIRDTTKGRDGWERFDFHEESYWKRRVERDTLCMNGEG